MSVDYSSVGGIGFYWEDLVARFKTAGIVPEDCGDMEDLLDGFCEKFGTSYSTIGNCFNGRTSYVILIKGQNFGEVKDNVAVFLQKMADKGITLQEGDLKVISEGLIW